ncbi:MAG TPA: amylosucrase, partial [Anaerolineales bacterium]|nr:amylosucrase [Anaerolineales bacterium]
MDEQGLQKQAGITLDRLMPRIRQIFKDHEPQNWEHFETRLERVFPRLFRLYHRLYSSRYDFYYHLETRLEGVARSWLARPADLKALDWEREADPLWFQSNKMLGGVIYVDLFAGDLQGVRAKIPYFKELGLTYLHLMPLFLAPEGDNDGGYAVSSYREVEPRLGSMKELAALGKELREHGISLVLDLVFNHTSDEHIWAQKAKTGDDTYQEYFRMFDDRSMPDAYESRLREIFPDEHPGAFTYWPEIKKWVWTTFHAYQWDLNYANPMVFNDMAQEMLFLANTGVEVLRLDAVAFIWKQLGTDCENLPEAHLLIQAFNAVARIAAPALLFKSEAIVHPDEVVRYIGPDECQLSYNPLVMALMWNSLATRETRLLDLALKERFAIDPHCAWVNYVRVHDDIGWTFSDEDAARLDINGYDHRRFLNAFYTGRFPGSFARGLPFQENPLTGDVRISGTCASLAGLEKGIRANETEEIEFAIRRILLLHGVILTLGGIPLIYLGDEIGAINDYSYQNDPAKARDSRWVHRPFTDWNRMGQRHDPETIPGRIYTGLQNLIRMRKEHNVFSGNEMTVIKQDNPHVLAYVRFNGSARALVFANFSERAQTIPGNLLRLYGLSYQFDDIASGESPAASVA